MNPLQTEIVPDNVLKTIDFHGTTVYIAENCIAIEEWFWAQIRWQEF